MKKIIVYLLLMLFAVNVFVGCNDKVKIVPDYQNAETFESALEKGEDASQKIVSFTIEKIIPNSFFGYNLIAGKHLNFVSAKNPQVQVGDKLIVRIIEVTTVVGSWIINYEILSR